MATISKRDVVKLALAGQAVPYVPWNMGFTCEPHQELCRHFGCLDLDQELLDNHFLGFGAGNVVCVEQGDGYVRDIFGVVWDRSVDRDIGVVKAPLLEQPTLAGYRFPNPDDPNFRGDIPGTIRRCPDRFRVYNIGFSLYERAWTLRGMENLMMDFVEHPEFVQELLTAIADFNLELIRRAVRYDIDAVYFGDDWGMQHGLQMGKPLWLEFIYPQLRRMYAAVKAAGKYVMIHSCGDVDELFDDLIDIGLDCFNPFQPEVMEVETLMERYRGRLSFHGGLSTQKTLPYGSPDEVRQETERLLARGMAGNYIFAPAHAVESDVPLANMLAFIETVQAQPGYRATCGSRACR